MGLSELCGDGCPQQLIGCPFPLAPLDTLKDPGSESCCPSALVHLQSQPSAHCSHWACGRSPSCHDDHHLPHSCFYHLHMCGRPFVSEGPDCYSSWWDWCPPWVAGGYQPAIYLFSIICCPAITFPGIYSIQHPCSLPQWRDIRKWSGTHCGRPRVWIFDKKKKKEETKIKKQKTKQKVHLVHLCGEKRSFLPGDSSIWTIFLNCNTWTFCPLWKWNHSLQKDNEWTIEWTL